MATFNPKTQKRSSINTTPFGAGGRTRTGTVSLPVDFETITLILAFQKEPYPL